MRKKIEFMLQAIAQTFYLDTKLPAKPAAFLCELTQADQTVNLDGATQGHNNIA